MKRFISIIILILIFNTKFATNAHAIGGLRQLFRGVVKIFKDSGDKVLKNIFKGKEEILVGSKNKGINKTILASGDEAKILETVGREEHSLHFASLKNNTRVRFIKKLKGKLGPDDVADLYDIDEWMSNSSSDSTNKGFYGVIMLNWIGKVYRNSNYYSNPELEEKMLLVCRTTNDFFYFALLMEQEPKEHS